MDPRCPGSQRRNQVIHVVDRCGSRFLPLRRFVVVTFACFLSGCASTADTESYPLVWPFPDTNTRTGYSRPIVLSSAHGESARKVEAEVANHLVDARRRVTTVSGVRFDLAIYDSTRLNAFVTDGPVHPLVVVSLPLLTAFGRDEDALAGILAHESAHVRLGHETAVRRRRETEEMRGSAPLAGALAAARIPAAGTIANATALSRIRAYTREEERDADRLALEWLRVAGYDTCGFARVLRRVQESAQEGASGGGYSTHPSTTERIATFSTAASAPCVAR